MAEWGYSFVNTLLSISENLSISSEDREDNEEKATIREMKKLLDKIIVVTAPQRLRIQRVLDRDKSRREEEIVKIIRNQMDEEEKIKMAMIYFLTN